MGKPTAAEQRALAATHCPDLLRRLVKLEQAEKRRKKRRADRLDEATRAIRREIWAEIMREEME